tara:strand:- start:1041 stop:1706 length:666 start_codon:yes stop_codon:yes gene_type:complete
MTTPLVKSTTDELIEELEAAAKAATPGDWKAKGTLFGEWSISTDYTTEGKRLENGRQLIAFSPAASKTNAPVYAAMFEANAKHMALCNPANVLALIADLRDLQRWKSEQLQVMTPVMEYAHSLNIAQLGHSVTQALIDDHKRLRELEEAQRWRTVSESPANDTNCIVADIRNGKISSYTAAWYIDDKFYVDVDALQSSNRAGTADIEFCLDITHWKPVTPP